MGNCSYVFSPDPHSVSTVKLCPDAESRRMADALPTSVGIAHFTISTVWPAAPSPLRGLDSSYDYVCLVSVNGVCACTCVP